ncbi:hypothetical protein A2331_02295 [Candidatus Falkowbacteria bacterium RIFOXYB2_FULL_34_18]|uniref:Adenylate kinase n=1 Tax=Candidatus Falkowbacteria bacterium RIFOXYD2_FULL_34_120 TaxID=1798007 RepID=A0A1F5TS25_9BACT|nr:MAG: hypothetical protein A2331_02295 [Candidatus Falkowbacteria bacterium RIFOXYB2_FULL_34_18]OGF29706.1 MAG: hypothetical protein A2500_00330 [Candidatus Falkowbacteria bacterium RIFOXYC12_FULL_34_55]OGF37429.1 MAG: hypothetical protein A2466_00390 [Candidatus Falkowbacteria bacterium RIFOXYC2_FULL_34_220]OGF39154.1 MAG: hypothetical protein A2515_00345 [Candidatus Falkowbacteria bacterium RIFOXYD12_FULL_34_57]OGF41703.1 MAG: hypothetical protein A2531_06065 [Candidatus Falkowbacteria bact
MNKRGKLIWATGISGCGRKEYLDKLKKLCGKQNKKIKIYNVGDIMFEIAKNNSIHITHEKVLDTPQPTLNALRAAVFERILGQINQDLEKNDIVIINVHTVFFWKDYWLSAYNVQYIRKFNPDMFINFIDSADKILERLQRKGQWKNQGLTEQIVWLWQNMEYNNTENYKYIFDEIKSFHTIPKDQPEETLYYLIFEPWRPIVYAQMPISHLDEQELEKVHEFIRWLWKYFIIIDPLTIDIKYSKAENEADMRARNNQTVIRDRYWHIGQCELCIAYFVKIVFTAGVVDETREAIDTNKDIYWIFPKDPGPFEKYLVDPKKIYRDLDAFKKHVEDVMVPEIEKRKEKYLNKEK